MNIQKKNVKIESQSIRRSGTVGKHFTEVSNEVELRINCVRINHARPVFNIDFQYFYFVLELSYLMKLTRSYQYIPSDRMGGK